MRLTNNCLIKVYYAREDRIELVDIPCKIYGYLAIHRHHDDWGAYTYAITHLPTGLRLPATGPKRLLRQFCIKHGKNQLLWDAIDYTKKINSKNFQDMLIELLKNADLVIT